MPKKESAFLSHLHNKDRSAFFDLLSGENFRKIFNYVSQITDLFWQLPACCQGIRNGDRQDL